MFDFDGLEEAMEAKGHEPIDIYATSDIHTDKRENMDVVRAWPVRPHGVLLLAGDVSNDLAIVRTTLELLIERFRKVFYCPGNHDLWLHPKDGCKDSVEKFRKLEKLCEELGVHTQPTWVDGVLIAPILSWYHAGFDAEPDISDDSLVPVEQMMSDYMLCRWPNGLSARDGCDSLARYFDSLNDERAGEVPPKDADRPPVISFSHFLPRPELLPEKRLLYFPPIAKAVGSRHLGERIRRMAPDLHIFGHTHYGWSAQLDGTHYLQACVAYPRERTDRPFSVYCTGEEGQEAAPPLLVYSHDGHRFPAYEGFWSKYYKVHPRCPHDLQWIYRPPRNQAAVTAAVRGFVGGQHGLVTDTAISALL
mmetsp:Transcript_6521/g.15027  ORF Transcript_6521/g.15027 Transcript_6521/m.15027 type:complete len:363 (-) Transcript_6521:111-1199(-)